MTEKLSLLVVYGCHYKYVLNWHATVEDRNYESGGFSSVKT